MLQLNDRVHLLASLTLAITASTFFGSHVAAQSEVKSAEDTGRIAVVKSNDVYVRSGAAESYYPFAKLAAGDMVKVTGEKFEWSRVIAVGPAFDTSFGYVKYAKGEAGRFRLAADGKSGVTLGKVDIIAPNLDTKNNPKDSWKALVRLEADQTLRVIETIETDKDTIHRVVLPESAQGWVSTAYLEAATPALVKQWEEALVKYAKAKADAAKPAPPAVKETPRTAANTTPPTVQPNKAVEVATNTTLPSPAKVLEPVITTTDETPSTDAVATDATAAAPAATEIAAAETTPHKPVVERRLPTLDDLEVALKQLQKEAIETAEVGPLRELYLDLARRSAGEARTVRFAHGRADQLQVWADLQVKRNELEALRARTRMSAEETIAVQKALERSAEYVAVGRVVASTIYDGQSLPKLLRLQDASTGRTVAYLEPDEQYELANLIGNLVGVVGEKNYDGALRLNIVTPKRIDMLMPEQRTATVPVNQGRPD